MKSSSFNGAAELLQRRGAGPRPKPAERPCFNGAAELLQRREGHDHHRALPGAHASTEPLNCFSGEVHRTSTRGLRSSASTEPLNCFSGEAVANAALSARSSAASTEPLNCFSGEVVPSSAMSLLFEASTEPLNCFSGEDPDLRGGRRDGRASTEPLNCFSGEATSRGADSARRARFNGAAELLQRRDEDLAASTVPRGSLQRSR